MNLSYALQEIARKGDDLGWWRQRFLSRVVGPSLKRILRRDRIDMMSEDWDNLMILDAARADSFKKCFDISEFDSYRRVHSPGCASPEWMRETFAGRSFEDTVYVTANPWIAKTAPDSFVETVNIWTETTDKEAEDFEDAIGLSGAGLEHDATIPASVVNDYALEAHERWPNKRLLVHYFQPHGPQIGLPDGDVRDSPAKVGMGRLKSGDITRDEYMNAYRDNLRYVMSHARNLSKNLGGRTVYSADHAELFGDLLTPWPVRGYGHLDGLHHPKMTEVPWAVEDGKRRGITLDQTSGHEMEDVDERLRDLGYKT